MDALGRSWWSVWAYFSLLLLSGGSESLTLRSRSNAMAFRLGLGGSMVVAGETLQFPWSTPRNARSQPTCLPLFRSRRFRSSVSCDAGAEAQGFFGSAKSFESADLAILALHLGLTFPKPLLARVSHWHKPGHC